MQIHDIEGLINTLRNKQYPLSIRDVAPHPDAVRLTGTAPDGLPSGVHTGGAWLLNGYVYKPLDCRPYQNCPYHFNTLELEVLVEMQGLPLFPVNWWVEEHNGRYFLVRPKAHLIPDDVPYSEIDREKALWIEQAILELNRRGWEVNDSIALAIDPGKHYHWFIYDMSAAQRMTGTGAYAANDHDRVIKLFRQCGQEWLVNLREGARRVRCDLTLTDRVVHRHVYGSMYRPMSSMWAKIEGATFIDTPRANLSAAIPHTWVVTAEPLDDETIRRYELTWGYSPTS